MRISYRASRILERLHDAIQTRGHQGLDEFRARLHEQCVDGKREATVREFVAAAAGGNDGFLSREEAEILFRALAGNGSKDSIPFAEILRALRSPTSRQRVALTRAVFDMIDQDRDGLLSRDEIIACYRAANHPSVRRGERTSADIRQDFLQTLSNITGMGVQHNHRVVVSFPAFLDFYCSLTAFTSDGDFREAIVAVWAPPVASDNEPVLHTLGCVGGLVANLRSQVIAHGLPAVVAFCRRVRNDSVEADDDAQELNLDGFCAAVSSGGARLTASEMTQAFRFLDRRGVGKIAVADALRAVRGELNARRARVIDDVFDSLLFRNDDGSGVAGENSQTLEPAAIARLFRAEAHPDVVSGARAQGEVLSEFLEAFEGGGEIDGRVTRAEWREHHLNVSALIADDDEFCEYAYHVWGCDGFGDPCSDGNTATTTTAHSNGDNNNNNINHSLYRTANRGPLNSPPYGPCGASASATAINGNSSPSNGNNGDGNTRPGPASTHPETREAWGASSPSPHSPLPTESVERAPILQRGGARDSAAARLAVPPGVLDLLERVRGGLATGGMHAAFRLLKGFREEDRRGRGRVTLSGFKKAIGGVALGLNEAEMRIVFQHLDEEGKGDVSYESFLRHMRDTLPDRRLALANKVFDRMDTDGDGLAFVGDIVRNFRSNAHPEVVAGSRDEEDVRREFFESFAVTNGSHKWCTRDDFIWWLELLSSSLPAPADDDRFESLVQACWGIPPDAGCGGGGLLGSQADDVRGGENQSMDMVVTHADGSVSIERISRRDVEIEVDVNSLGGQPLISESQANRVRRQLASQGINAVHVHLLRKDDLQGATSTTNETPGASRSPNAPAAGSDIGSVSHDGSSSAPRGGGHRPSSDELQIARLGPSGNREGSAGSGCLGGGEAGLGFDHGLLSVLQVARKRLAQRGPVGFISLSRRLRSVAYFRRAVSSSRPVAPAAAAAGALAAAPLGVNATDSGGAGRESGPFVSLGCLKEALSGIGCGLTGKDLTNVFMHLDDTGCGEIPVEVVIQAIRGRLMGKRLSIVGAAFTRLRGSGGAPPDAAAAVNVAFQFDPTGHPDVIAGRRSSEDVRKEFMDGLSTEKGFVTWKDFESYYTDVSAATPSDEYFCLQVQGCWRLGSAAAAYATATTAAPTNPAAVASTAAAGASTVRLSGDFEPAFARRTYSKARTSAPPGVLPGTAEGGIKLMASGRAGSRTTGRVPTAGVAAIIRKLGLEVQGHGAAWGLARLRRALFDADRNNDGFLSFGDLKTALSSSGAGLTAPEVRALFVHLEMENGSRRAGGGGGDVSSVAPWQSLIDAIRPRLSGERLGLVRLAFRKMDKEGKGYVSPETITYRFIASRHPAVLRGYATTEEVRQELLDTFFAGSGAHEGRVAEEEFVEHHANISFGIKSDADFRDLVVNCWGLGGGDSVGNDGLSANGANVLRRATAPHRKFLVSYADGLKCVEDLPFSTADPEQGESEASLTTAEERVLKRELSKPDNINATQVTLLPQMCPAEAAPDSERKNSLASTNENPNTAVDRRHAWTWAPMNLSEIQAAATAAAAAAAAGGTSGRKEPGDKSIREQGGSDKAPGSPAVLGRQSEGRPSARQCGEGDGFERWGTDFEGEEGDGGGAGGRARQRLKAGGKRVPAGQGREADLSVRYLLRKLRSELNTRGVAGMAHLSCRLREAAVVLGGNGSCSHGVGEIEFRRALREADLPLTESDMHQIFAHFEIGHSGVMNLRAFMDRLGGRMDDRRSALVDEAFGRLDTSGHAHLALDQIIDAFDATKHPAVISGCQQPDAVFRDFVDGFLAGFPAEKRAEARATKEDFRRYYDIVSKTIPDDGYFDLLLRRCWPMRPRGGNVVTSDSSVATGDDHANWGNPVQQESSGTPFDGRARRYFHPPGETVRGGPKSGNCHFSSPPMVLTPNEGREGSFHRLRESHAAGSRVAGRSSVVGPSDKKWKLRSERLSRTFDSQIFFGGSAEEEALERCRLPGAAAGSGDPTLLPPPAGGGKLGRGAEGAAWTPGGRRLIPGSTAFQSHLGSGMIAKGAAAAGAEGDDGASSSGSRRLLGPAKRSRAAKASMEPPVWILKPAPKSSVPAAVAADTGGVAAGGNSLVGSISLAHFLGSSGEQSNGLAQELHRTGDEVFLPASRLAASKQRFTEHNHNNLSASGGGPDGGTSSDPGSVFAATGRGRGRRFDWWGGASALDHEENSSSAEKGSREGEEFKPRPKTVSDTYRSSLVFG